MLMTLPAISLSSEATQGLTTGMMLSDKYEIQPHKAKYGTGLMLRKAT